MSATEYFLPLPANGVDLSPWASILPAHYRVLRIGLFGDAFLVDQAGAVHRLDLGGCFAEPVASSEEGFWRDIVRDLQNWQLRDLADECRQAGKVLTAEQCYAFTTLPVLGGDYSVENVWVAPWREWLSFSAALFEQIAGLPDGATISLQIVD